MNISWQAHRRLKIYIKLMQSYMHDDLIILFSNEQQLTKTMVLSDFSHITFILYDWLIDILEPDGCEKGATGGQTEPTSHDPLLDKKESPPPPYIPWTMTNYTQTYMILRSVAETWNWTEYTWNHSIGLCFWYVCSNMKTTDHLCHV